MAKVRSKISEDAESETDLDSMTESSQRPKNSRPGGPFSFEPMITDSENLTDSGDSAVRQRGETARFIMVRNNTQYTFLKVYIREYASTPYIEMTQSSH